MTFKKKYERINCSEHNALHNKTMNQHKHEELTLIKDYSINNTDSQLHGTKNSLTLYFLHYHLDP